MPSRCNDGDDCLNVVPICGTNTDEPESGRGKRRINKSIATPALRQLVRTVVQLNRYHNVCREGVVKHEVDVLLAEPTAVSSVPESWRAMDDVREARLDGNRQRRTMAGDRAQEHPVKRRFTLRQ